MMLVCMGLAACGATETPADRAIENGVLIVGNGADPDTLDPHLLIGMPEANIVAALSEGLVVLDPDDSRAVRPGVAERWVHSSDYLRWTFHLRRDARWSDGAPLTARDFVYSFRRMLSPALGSEGADLLYVIRNARAYNRRELTEFAQVGIKAPDDHTLELTLEYPAQYLLPMLAGTNFVPVNRVAVEAGGGIDNPDNRWARAGTYVGNGPFLLSEWHVNREVLVERNPQYWDAANVALNAVRFLPIDDPKAETQAFLAGELHVTQTVAAGALERLREERPGAVNSEAMLGAYLYEFNTRRPPLDDERVRRALALAVDRQTIASSLATGQAAIGGIVPPGIPDYKTVPAAPPRVGEARELLAQAGYPGGAGFPEVTLLINRFTLHRRVADMVTRGWAKNLGIKVKVREASWKTYLARMADDNFDIARSGWVAGYFDPGGFLEIMTSDGISNRTGWSDPAYDALIAEARTTTDRSRHMMLMRKAEDLMLAQQPLIPIMNYSQTYLLDPRVKGWGNSIGGERVYKFMSFASN